MPAPERPVDPDLIADLFQSPWRFGFFQALRLLASFLKRTWNESGHEVLNSRIRFRHSLSMGFPVSEMESVTGTLAESDDLPEAVGGSAGADSERSERRLAGIIMTPLFMGLVGPSGVLPTYYTQSLADEEYAWRNTAMRAFFDIFLTRAVTMFYQAWMRSNLPVQHEWDREGRFPGMLRALAGLGQAGMPAQLEQAGFPHGGASLVRYAAAIRERPHSIWWFADIVSEHFGITCRVRQFVGQWIRLAATEHSVLGKANHALGRIATCGQRVWDRSAMVALTLGPLRRDRYTAFLPGQPAERALHQLFRLLVDLTFDYEVELILDERDVVPAHFMPGRTPCRLGWDTWLGISGCTGDKSGVNFRVDATRQ